MEAQSGGGNQMECVCGEVLKSEVRDGLWGEYQKHLLRADHKCSPNQWTEAAIRIEKAKERAKKAGLLSI